MSDSSRHNLYAIAEVTYGTTPATPAFKTIRHTGTTLGLSKETITSEELRSDRQVVDVRHGNKQVGGDVPVELSYGNFDDFLEAVLLGTWARKATKTATTISAANTDDSFNDSGNGFVTAGFQAGDRITVSGFTGNVANNASYLIVAVTAGKITTTKVDGTAASNIVDDAAGESVTIVTDTYALKAGTTRRSFSVLRDFSDITSGRYLKFTGVELNKLDLSIAVNAMVKATFGVMGKGQTVADTAPSGATYVAANTNSPFDTFSGVISEAGTPIAVVTELTLTLENGLEARFVIGSDETLRPSIGRSNLSGQVTAYFEDAALLQKFIDEEESDLTFSLTDLSGNTYTFVLPRIKYNGGQPDTQGQGAITLALPIQALYDSVSASQIVVYRLPAA